MRFWSVKLSTRLAVAAAVIVPLLVFLAGALLVHLLGRDLRNGQDTALRARAKALAPQAQLLLRAEANDQINAERTRSSILLQTALDDGVRLVTPDDTIKAGPQPPDAAPLPTPGPRTTITTVRYDGKEWRAVAEPVQLTRPTPTQATLWVFTSETQLHNQLNKLSSRVVLVTLLAIPLSGLVGAAVAGVGTRSLRRLRARAAGLDPSRDSNRDVYVRTGVAEVDELGQTLSTVLARYDEQAARTGEALETARSFAAAAAHELRTPLTSMRTNLDVLEAHPDLDPEERAEVLEDVRSEHARVLGLLHTLRELAQGDLVDDTSFGPVDVAEVAHAAGAQQGVLVRAPASAYVHGWEPGLRMAVDNLVTNALVHGRRPVTVSVQVVHGEADAGEVVIAVEDEGDGVPASERDTVFERFHRGTSSPGSGLGLTLVAQQAALHGGTVAIRDRADGRRGARLEFRVPYGPGTGAGRATAPGEWVRHDWLTGVAGDSGEFRAAGRPAADFQEPGKSQGFHKDPS